MTDSQGPYVFIMSWERPVYLWVCLDSLYRTTNHPCRFVLVDNHSQDPLVRTVITGFQRRGLFHRIHMLETNEPSNFNRVLSTYLDDCGDHFYYLESDIAVYTEDNTSWLSDMEALVAGNPRLGMLGSYIDTTDFVDPPRVRELVPSLSDERFEQLIKAESPERNLPTVPPGEPLINPFNPPGRLLMLKTEPIRRHGMLADLPMHECMLENGYETAISTQVRHRHLSLLHVFDEPDYDTLARTEFFTGFGHELDQEGSDG